MDSFGGLDDVGGWWIGTTEGGCWESSHFLVHSLECWVLVPNVSPYSPCTHLSAHTQPTSGSSEKPWFNNPDAQEVTHFDYNSEKLNFVGFLIGAMFCGTHANLSHTSVYPHSQFLSTQCLIIILEDAMVFSSHVWACCSIPSTALGRKPDRVSWPTPWPCFRL